MDNMFCMAVTFNEMTEFPSITDGGYRVCVCGFQAESTSTKTRQLELQKMLLDRVNKNKDIYDIHPVVGAILSVTCRPI